MYIVVAEKLDYKYTLQIWSLLKVMRALRHFVGVFMANSASNDMLDHLVGNVNRKVGRTAACQPRMALMMDSTL